jgi:hypothetical protein
MSYASWPYDRSTTNPINTLAGRISRPAAAEPTPVVPERPAAPAAARPDDKSEPYRWSVAGLLRVARGTS